MPPAHFIGTTMVNYDRYTKTQWDQFWEIWKVNNTPFGPGDAADTTAVTPERFADFRKRFCEGNRVRYPASFEECTMLLGEKTRTATHRRRRRMCGGSILCRRGYGCTNNLVSYRLEAGQFSWKNWSRGFSSSSHKPGRKFSGGSHLIYTKTGLDKAFERFVDYKVAYKVSEEMCRHDFPSVVVELKSGNFFNWFETGPMLRAFLLSERNSNEVQ